MYRVAICDDESTSLRAIGSLAESILDDCGVPYAIDLFTAPKTLLAASRSCAGRYDVILLDILMGELSGLEVAGRLREAGDDVSIVLISGSDRFLADGYDVRALKYILKPVSGEALRKALVDDLMRNYFPTHVALRCGGDVISLAVRDIVYIESMLRQLSVHCLSGKVLHCRGKLDELVGRLPSGTFARCHKSFFVNLAYVERLTRQQVLLSNGAAVPISRACSVPFREALLAFLNGSEIVDEL